MSSSTPSFQPGAADDGTSLSGRFLIAMPGMPDPRFAKTVIYMCAHSAEGAMGLVINKPMDGLTFPELLEQMNIAGDGPGTGLDVLVGGPVESGRGFVLHTDDYLHDASLMVEGGVALTATVDILRAIAHGTGPDKCLFALGYAGWGPGQLDSEIKANGWLHVDADQTLLFDPDTKGKWERAMAKLGIDPLLLVDEAGHA
ncbi:MAG: YqgE/AlgH family protein [Rhodobacterales bacterium]|nr:YqgE/AlgH family protein [Rhodobacterales bacterium]